MGFAHSNWAVGTSHSGGGLGTVSGGVEVVISHPGLLQIAQSFLIVLQFLLQRCIVLAECTDHFPQPSILLTDSEIAVDQVSLVIGQDSCIGLLLFSCGLPSLFSRCRECAV